MMNMQQQAQAALSEKEILQDSLLVQKHITDSYNTFAGECVNPQLRTTMLNILNDEHCIQADIFTNMQNHGWYTVEQAEQQKIQQARKCKTNADGAVNAKQPHRHPSRFARRFRAAHVASCALLTVFAIMLCKRRA